MTGYQLRSAGPEDAEAIAAVFSPSIRSLAFMPALHSVAEDRWFIENVILRECAVTLAIRGDAIAAFLARDGAEIRLLHAHPSHFGRGAGSALIDAAKASAFAR